MDRDKNKLLRVTQMNAIYLDREIYNSLYQLFLESTTNLAPGLVALYETEIKFLLKFFLLKNSILKNGNTFGQQLLSIKYNNISTTQSVLYVVGSCLDYIKTKFEIWKPSHQINEVIFNLYVIIKFLDFINLSIFLRNGKKPQLIERILGLDQVYATENAQRRFESKYLARELLWNGFIEILVFILPLINFHKVKRIIKKVYPIHKNTTSNIAHKRNMTIQTKCGFCGENPIIPHHMGCAHIFCYVCLKGNQQADSLFECPVCEHRNLQVICERVTGI